MGVSERTGLDRGWKEGNCRCRYKITLVRVTRKVDDIRIRKKRYGRQNFERTYRIQKRGKEGVARVRYGSCL
jgi:hypothetical protein